MAQRTKATKRPWRLEWRPAGSQGTGGWTVSSEYSSRTLALIAKAAQGSMHGDREYQVMKNVHFESKS